MRRMLARIEGQLSDISTDTVIIDTHGVGYEVMLSARTMQQLPALGETVILFLHTHVREDQFALFGFLHREERNIFRRLISVSGIGPRLALAVLSGLEPHDLVQTVANEDAARLSTIPGIGKKTAERIILDLRDRLLKDHAGLLGVTQMGSAGTSTQQDVISALVNLGYSPMLATSALQKLGAHAKGAPIGTLIRETLKILAPR